MTTERLTRPSDVLSTWAIFDEGLSYLAGRKELYYNELQAKKLICSMAADHQRAHVSVVFTDDGDPLAFALFQENTLPFSNYRTFICRALYYRQGNPTALLSLFGAFEQWCQQHSVRRYAIQTRRQYRAALRSFANEKYGFNKLVLVFEKTL